MHSFNNYFLIWLLLFIFISTFSMRYVFIYLYICLLKVKVNINSYYQFLNILRNIINKKKLYSFCL